MAKITHIVLHYSATPDNLDIGVAEIDAMHKARGWKGVGYHYVIRLDGTVEKGRSETELGAHVAGQNSGKLGICAIGGTKPGAPNTGLDTRTAKQIEAQIALIRTLLSKYPNAKVVGHRDLAATQCPGFDVVPWWASVQKGAPSIQPPKMAVVEDLKAGGVVAVDSLILRDLPGGAQIGSMPRGTTLTISARRGEWLRVTTPFPVTGWAHGDFITISPAENDEDPRIGEALAKVRELQIILET